jgi:hypothetical protein
VDRYDNRCALLVQVPRREHDRRGPVARRLAALCHVVQRSDVHPDGLRRRLLPVFRRLVQDIPIGDTLAIAVAPLSGRIYLAEDNGVSVLDPSTFARVARIDVSAVGTSTYRTPLWLSVTPDGTSALRVDAVPATPTGSGIEAVHVWAYPEAGGNPIFVGAATPTDPRPDVASAVGAQFSAPGFHVSASSLPPGRYTLVVFALDMASGAFRTSRTVRIVVTAPTPLIAVDAPRSGEGVGGSFVVAGWALELGATAGIGVDAVQVWAYPNGGGAAVFVGSATYWLARPDVGSIYGGECANSGFSLTGGCRRAPTISSCLRTARRRGRSLLPR